MGWNPWKKCSAKEKASLEFTNASRHKKENLPTPTTPTRHPTHINNAVITSEDQLLASQLRAERFQRKLQNEGRKSAHGTLREAKLM
jgi:hypothetical protein